MRVNQSLKVSASKNRLNKSARLVVFDAGVLLSECSQAFLTAMSCATQSGIVFEII